MQISGAKQKQITMLSYGKAAIPANWEKDNFVLPRKKKVRIPHKENPEYSTYSGVQVDFSILFSR